ncbi:lantibiotic (srt) production protein, partial [Streptococcus suis]
RLARYDYAKMNLTAGATLSAVESELRTRQKELNNRIDNYEYQVKKLEKFVRIVNDSIDIKKEKVERFIE